MALCIFVCCVFCAFVLASYHPKMMHLILTRQSKTMYVFTQAKWWHSQWIQIYSDFGGGIVNQSHCNFSIIKIMLFYWIIIWVIPSLTMMGRWRVLIGMMDLWDGLHIYRQRLLTIRCFTRKEITSEAQISVLYHLKSDSDETLKSLPKQNTPNFPKWFCLCDTGVAFCQG